MRRFLVLFFLISGPGVFSQKHVEAHLVIDYHENIVPKNQRDSLNLCPPLKTLSAWFKETDLLTDCLKRCKKAHASADVAKTRKNLNVKVDETEHYLYISFYDTDLDFALMFTDTLVYSFGMRQLAEMYKWVDEQSTVLNREIDEMYYFISEIDNALQEFSYKKGITDFDKEKALCFNELLKHDSLKKMYGNYIEGLQQIEELVYEEKELYKDYPEIILGYQNATLYGLFCEAEEYRRNKDTGNTIRTIHREILVYTRELRKIFAEKIKTEIEEIHKYNVLSRKFVDHETEYRTLISKKEFWRGRMEIAQKRKASLVLYKSTIMPVVKVSILPYIVP
jgi:hypothetical protein